MRIRHAAAAAAIALSLALTACSQQGPQPPAVQQPIPPDSPWAKVKPGMTTQQVMNLLGVPTDQTSYATGKAWIPYYFGDDVRRTAFFYKGQGHVVFTGGNVFGGGGGEVVSVVYDPNESGVAR